MTDRLFGYDVLIERFLNQEITVHEFERQYIDKFLSGDEPLSEPVYLELDWLFAEVDAFTDLPMEPEDDPDNYINEDQLRKSAEKVLKEIRGEPL